MAFKNNPIKKEFFLTPEGSHVGKLYSIVNIGDHVVQTDKGEAVKTKVTLTFELQEVLIADGRPAAISQTYNVSLHEKATLRPVVVALLGGSAKVSQDIDALLDNPEGADITHVLQGCLGKAALLQVIHNKGKGAQATNTYANIASVISLPTIMAAAITPVVNHLLFVDDPNLITAEQEKLLSPLTKKKLATRLNGSSSVSDEDINF